MSAPALSVFIQGQSTVSADNLNTFVQGGVIASQLRALTGLPGMTAFLTGITTPNDGQGGFFYWNAAGTEPDDNLNYIQPEGTGTGEWVRISLLQAISDLSCMTLLASGLATFESDVTIGGILSVSTAPNLTATGSTQQTALLLAASKNIFTTVASNTGGRLPIENASGEALPIGSEIQVFNRGANILSVYPQSGAQIETLGANNPSGIVPGGNARFLLAGSAQWYVS